MIVGSINSRSFRYDLDTFVKCENEINIALRNLRVNFRESIDENRNEISLRVDAVKNPTYRNSGFICFILMSIISNDKNRRRRFLSTDCVVSKRQRRKTEKPISLFQLEKRCISIDHEIFIDQPTDYEYS